MICFLTMRWVIPEVDLMCFRASDYNRSFPVPSEALASVNQRQRAYDGSALTINDANNIVLRTVKMALSPCGKHEGLG